MGRGAAILLSRQSLYPSGADAWVQQTCQAAAWVKQNRHRLVATVGMPTWELVVTLGYLYDIPLTLLLPNVASALNREICIRSDFALEQNDVQFVYVDVPAAHRTVEAIWIDNQIVDYADILIPVSIRPRGNWERLLADSQNKQIISAFQTAYAPKNLVCAYQYPKTIHPDIQHLKNEYLFHWTRTTRTPWPNERLVDFYAAIISSSVYPRSAFAALQNILATDQIYASSRHMANDVNVVSFSALSPAEMLPFMRWRQRYREMSFEPYGIGIRKDTAFAAGARAVEYLTVQELKRLAHSPERWRFQSEGAYTDWRQEKEYRFPASVSLDQFDVRDMVVITKTETEAQLLANQTDIPMLPFFTDTPGVSVLRTGRRDRAAAEKVIDEVGYVVNQ